MKPHSLAQKRIVQFLLRNPGPGLQTQYGKSAAHSFYVPEPCRDANTTDCEAGLDRITARRARFFCQTRFVAFSGGALHMVGRRPAQLPGDGGLGSAPANPLGFVGGIVRSGEVIWSGAEWPEFSGQTLGRRVGKKEGWAILTAGEY